MKIATLTRWLAQDTPMPELSAPVAAFATCAVCLALAGLLIVACRHAERLPPPSYLSNLLARLRAGYRWRRWR